jgi:hypothetical protein
MTITLKTLIRITFFLAIFGNFSLYAQYSNYYNIYSQTNSNVNANINQNVSGTIYQHSTQTIKTIDYGALALANAQKEQNKIELQKIADENQKRILTEIIAEPVKAYDYGQWEGFNSSDKKILDKKTIQQYQDISGLKGFGYYFVFPAMFFTKLDYWNWQNVSSDGVITEIILKIPKYNTDNKIIDYEDFFENNNIVVIGKENEMYDDTGKIKKVFFHKKELNLATVFSTKGYKSTYIWEDKFENGITDNYMVLYNNNTGNGVEILVKVRYYGDKDEITFEQLEGRRYYLKGLIEKIISTARLQDIKLQK